MCLGFRGSLQWIGSAARAVPPIVLHIVHPAKEQPMMTPVGCHEYGRESGQFYLCCW